MSNLASSSNTDSTMLQVPKLRDDGSNWSDYQPRIQKVMGSKGLWRHVEGKTVVPKPYEILNGSYILSDLKTLACPAHHSFDHLDTSWGENKRTDIFPNYKNISRQ